jgi:hypothetical protein
VTGIGIEDKDGKRDWRERREKVLERRKRKGIGEKDGKQYWRDGREMNCREGREYKLERRIGIGERASVLIR